MRKFVIVGFVIGVALLALSQRITITERLLERGMAARMSANKVAGLEDGLHITLCGAGGPMPAPAASGPCVAVVAGQDLYVVDAGTDGLRNLARMGYPTGDIKAVLLTHFHSDHIDGLGEMGTIRWVGAANTTPLPVYGPPGVAKVVNGLNMAYAQDFVYRHEHHGDSVAPLSGAGLEARYFPAPQEGVLTPVLESNGLTVEALRVDHAPVAPAVAYKFSYKGRTALISGDTDESANLERFAQGVDLLVHEALAPNLLIMMNKAAVAAGNAPLAKITLDVLTYHASPVEVAETARDAQVGHLLYYHIVPPMVAPGQEALWLNGAEDIFPDYTVGTDGVSFSLPANSDVIEQTASGL